MTTPRLLTTRAKQPQRGAAAIMLVLIVLLGLITLFTFKLDRKKPSLDADKRTAMVLAQAKDALLGRAAANNDPGTLPCPDFDGNGLLIVGSADYAGPECASYLGWLPWSSLDLDDPRDGGNGKLWYMLSNHFKDNNNNPVPSTIATLSITGISPQSNLVAIVVAPGAPVPGQNQPTANATGYAQYLESYVNGTTLNAMPPSASYNDRFLAITWSELFTVVTMRAARSFAKELPLTFPASGWVPSTNEWASGNQPFSAWANNTVTQYTAPATPGAPATLRFPPCAALYSIQHAALGYQVSRAGNC